MQREKIVSNIQVLNGSQALSEPPKVYISQKAFQQIKCFIDLMDCEINGLGTVEKIGNDFLIKEAFIIKQIAEQEGYHVETDSKALNLLIYELVQRNESPSSIRFQWHSHVDGMVFFSSEDMDTIGEYMNDYMISLVMNKYGEYKCRLDLFKPFYLSLEIPLIIVLSPLNKELVKQCQDDIRQHVSIKPTLQAAGFPKNKQSDGGNTRKIKMVTANANRVTEKNRKGGVNVRPQKTT